MTDMSLIDGVVTLRPSTSDDASPIIAGRDAAFHRFIGEGSAVPAPESVIVVNGLVVGWVDHDRDDDRWWLAPEEVNIGYHVFPAHRGRGAATRAVHLMLEHFRTEPTARSRPCSFTPRTDPRSRSPSGMVSSAPTTSTNAPSGGDRYTHRAEPPRPDQGELASPNIAAPADTGISKSERRCTRCENRAVSPEQQFADLQPASERGGID